MTVKIDIFDPPSLEEIEKIHGPMPQPGRVLTPEEQVKAAARPPPRPNYSRKGERWARERLVKLLGAELVKNTDELKSYERNGKVHYYRTGGLVDFSGKVMLHWDGQARATPVEMEVKTFQDSFPVGMLERQYDALDQARQRSLTLVCLVEHNQGTILRGWYIPWRRPGDSHRGRLIRQLDVMDYADLLGALEARASGNYKGKSFRQEDHDLLVDHVVRKVGGQWQLCCWLEGLRYQDGVQPLLF